MIYAVWIVAVLSCAYRMTDEDWEKNGKVRLLLRRPDSDCPENMMWYFYAEGSDIPIIRTGDMKGYEGTLPSGCYRVAVCNRGCTGVTLEMEKGYEEACGRAQRLSSLKSSSVQIACPGNLYGAGLDLIEVGGREVVAKELSAVNLVCTLEMNIKVIRGDKGDVALAHVLDSHEESKKGVIFDGFPRTIAQAEALTRMLAERNAQVDVVLGLEVEEKELIDRLLKRGQVSGRSDDNLETIQKRLDVYHNQTKPLKDFYQKEKKYRAIQGMGSVDDIFKSIKSVISEL